MNERSRERGYVHIYTGDGKGKTTAALGLTLRAVGAGWRVFWGQFLKEGEFSEIKAMRSFGGQVVVQQYGAGRFIRGRPCEEDIKLARKGFDEIKGIVRGGLYDMVVMDEINVAMHYGLIGFDEMKELLESRPSGVEIILTGRWADETLFKDADVVTEMRCIKHYYERGITARVGVEK
ncbi:cob(I)yrinic acid a,c-diamide adenosyltransferase [Dissulfurimicrobium hydrothermale]|uniref:cob(I)yrinic acid a,c-diamide adenosyltransferase n=1 Tax=Dissulfurimicrobium hydrothermale TaxID=1750598 RepID=UPI001EDC254F|nr:cob(I)yrinic acid a,c-diamide adenosyltransferase [Dissulfurimicrobium hydrothermale]UKL13519.1 cob(I)yrinic acid a,c-diamide adenosyltransferase [Dissulfurimicrobium hydrothermale]